MGLMIELTEGFWVSAEDIKVIKRIDDKRCALWVSGQSAIEGFVLECAAEDILRLLGYSDEEEDEDHDDENDESTH
jgi:hypothetical protein